MSPKRRIVVVEDEPAIRRGVVDILRMAGYEPVEAADGEVGLKESRRAGVDLVLLDLMLPKVDGFDVLAALRETHASLPVIILTARGAEEDRVRGLKLGADDYVVKPFSSRELLARVEAVLRRSPERPEPVVRLKLGKTVADCARHELNLAGGQRVALSEMEAELLRRLALQRGQAVSRESLLSSVWGIRDGRVETRAIDMHITRLRNKLSGEAPDAEGQDWIVTVRGKGYMLGAEVEVLAEAGATVAP